MLRVIELEKCKDSLQVLHDEIFDLHKLESVHQPIQLKVNEALPTVYYSFHATNTPLVSW